MVCPRFGFRRHVDIEANLRELAVLLPSGRRHLAVCVDVRESLVLLKNKDSILPLSRNQNVLVAGSAANNIGQQTGGWSLSWQGDINNNNDYPNATSVFAGIRDVVTAGGGNATSRR